MILSNIEIAEAIKAGRLKVGDFTAPTIHAGFEGTITLEIINLGPFTFYLYPDMFLCQLIIEQVYGIVSLTPGQFRGQTTPSGT